MIIIHVQDTEDSQASSMWFHWIRGDIGRLREDKISSIKPHKSYDTIDYE